MNFIHHQEASVSNRRVREIKKAAHFGLRPGARTGGLSADIVGDMAAKIYRENGRIDAELWVSYATPIDSPTHNSVLWDDTAAAHEYRLQQARTIVRSVVVLDEEGKQSPVYVHVSAELGYQPVSLVIGDVDMFTAALQQLHRKLGEAQNVAEQLQRAAKQADGEHDDRIAIVSIASQALQTAQHAIMRLH